MVSYLKMTNFDPFGRTNQSPFGFSFWSWQGNQISFSQSQLIYWIVIMITITIIILMWAICKPLQFSRSFSLTISHQIVGAILITLTIFRIVLLATGNYPHLWELIPLHFCRLMIVLIGLSLITKQKQFFKYLLVFTIIGAWFGIIFTDLNNSDYWQAKGGVAIGYDNYFFWDFLIIHCLALIISSYFLNTYRLDFTKRGLLISTSCLTILTILIFFANWATASLSNKRWNANWFYLAPNQNNSVILILKPLIGNLASWPWLLLVFLVLGYGLVAITYVLYFAFDYLIINQWRLVFNRNPQWHHFKTTHW